MQAKSSPVIRNMSNIVPRTLKTEPMVPEIVSTVTLTAALAMRPAFFGALLLLSSSFIEAITPPLGIVMRGNQKSISVYTENKL